MKRRAFSIVRRLTTLVVAVSLLSLCLNGAMLVVAVAPLVDDLADGTARQIEIVRRILQRSDAAQRDTLAASFAHFGAQVSRLPADRHPADFGAEGEPLPAPLRARLQRTLGADVVLSGGDSRATGGPRRLLASFDVDGQPWRVELDSAGPSGIGPLPPLLATLTLVGLAAVLAIVFGIRLVTRPMARIASEVTARHDDLRPLDSGLPVGIELQPVIDAFNGLVRALARANEARRNMLAGLSHDLRTPLARLRLRAECECSEPVAAAMEQDFAALGHIVDQFLAYAQGRAGVQPGSPEPLDELVRHIVLPYAAQGVTLDMDEAAAAGWACPDLALQRMLANLIDNALSHGRAPVTVKVSFDGGHCRLMVHDAGQGIAADALARALEPFVKLGSEAAGLGHCGLGLAIVDDISRRLGGRVVQRAYDGRDSAIGVQLPPQAAGASG